MWMNKVEGLCGNFDDKSTTEFGTMTVVEYGNYWKDGTDCPDVEAPPVLESEPCAVS